MVKEIKVLVSRSGRRQPLRWTRRSEKHWVQTNRSEEIRLAVLRGAEQTGHLRPYRAFWNGWPQKVQASLANGDSLPQLPHTTDVPLLTTSTLTLAGEV